jgi:hypothetical protein
MMGGKDDDDEYGGMMMGGKGGMMMGGKDDDDEYGGMMMGGKGGENDNYCEVECVVISADSGLTISPWIIELFRNDGWR